MHALITYAMGIMLDGFLCEHGISWEKVSHKCPSPPAF